MYEVFDPFLRGETWHTPAATDRAEFYKVLEKVVGDSAFNADDMGEYMKTKAAPGLHPAVDKLVTEAHAVRDYLRATANL